MAKTEWMMKGKYVKSCNCALGCPCDFWDTPTPGFCEGMLGMEIIQGYFGTTSLTGLKFAGLYKWPGPLHEGKGEFQPILDEKASPDQRNALLTILSGKAGNPWFEVVSSLISQVHEPLFLPIEFKMDKNKRHVTVKVPGILEMTAEPIKDAFGHEHQIRVDLPKGMEYFSAETARTKVNKASGKISFNCPDKHSSVAHVIHTQDGLVSSFD